MFQQPYLHERLAASAVTSMSSDKLRKWWHELYDDPEYSHPEMDIQQIIEEELERRGEASDFDTLVKD